LLLYYITDRQQFSGPEREKRERLLARIASAAKCGIDFIQLRERDLPARELEALAAEALAAIHNLPPSVPTASGPGKHAVVKSLSKLLVNSRIDVALAIGADGVHLRAADMAASEARALAARVVQNSSATATDSFLISVACHNRVEVRLAESHGADLVLFAPVFEKHMGESLLPQGITGLRAVCRDRRAARPAVPVLALGGLTIHNAGACLRAGAAGVAAIRLFQEGDLDATVAELRDLK
jgi:thiamine-phosphate pyrophosphorylase